MAPRQKVPAHELTEILVTQASALLGHDARFIAPHIKVKHHADGGPNWDAKLDIFGSARVARENGALRCFTAVRFPAYEFSMA
jgi:hypothetical protein